MHVHILLRLPLLLPSCALLSWRVAATAPAAATIAAPEDAVAAVADVAIIRRLLLLPGSCVLQIENKTINYLALKFKIH